MHPSFHGTKIKKSNLHYTRGTETSGGARLRGIVPGQYSSKETPQRWRAL